MFSEKTVTPAGFQPVSATGHSRRCPEHAGNIRKKIGKSCTTGKKKLKRNRKNQIELIIISVLLMTSVETGWDELSVLQVRIVPAELHGSVFRVFSK